MQTGWPAQPAANVARLAPGFSFSFSAPALGVAAIATIAWIGLVKWRAGRHRAAIWKSLVLPASGAALCWLLLMSLWLPLLNFGRGYAPLVEKVSTLMGPTACVNTQGLALSQSAAFAYHGRYRLIPLDAPNAPECHWLIADHIALDETEVSLHTWRQRETIFRPTDDGEAIVVFERVVP